MKSFDCFVPALCGLSAAFPATGFRRRVRRSGSRPCRGLLAAAVLLAVFLGMGRSAQAQAAPSADAGGIKLSVGGTVSGYYLQYGELKILGGTAFVDADTLRHLGVEGEARWLVFHMKANDKGPAADEHAATYLVGPRYTRYIGRFQPYAKALVGFGQFNYPYNLGTDNDMVIAPGGGFDYRLTRRIRIRAVDFEYQMWPQFHYGQMTSYGVSTGLKIKIF